MTIDRVQLRADQDMYLPSSNSLTEAQMSSINESVISEVGDDEANYNEVLCKSLRRIAEINSSKWSVDVTGIKKGVIDDLEIERFEKSSINPWGEYLKKLPSLCASFGYKDAKPAIGMVISPGKIKNPKACCITPYNTTKYY